MMFNEKLKAEKEQARLKFLEGKEELETAKAELAICENLPYGAPEWMRPARDYSTLYRINIMGKSRISTLGNYYSNSTKRLKLAEELLEMNTKAMTDQLCNHFTLKADGLYWQGNWISSPLFVYKREARGDSWYVNVAFLSADNCWLLISIPASELNDHGAKMRARLLRESVNVAVDTILRRYLLHFLLNSKQMLEGEQS